MFRNNRSIEKLILILFSLLFFYSTNVDVRAQTCEVFGVVCAVGDVCTCYQIQGGLGDACYCNPPPPFSFLPGTLVQSRVGPKKIEEIRVGDEVLSFKDEKIAYSKVIRIFKYPKPYYYILEAGEYMVDRKR